MKTPTHTAHFDRAPDVTYAFADVGAVRDDRTGKMESDGRSNMGAFLRKSKKPRGGGNPNYAGIMGSDYVVRPFFA